MGRSNTKPLNKTISKANYTAVPVDGLPEGWRVEIGTPESGNHSGRKDKCYIAPVTGNKCYSKGDVSRYLESGSKQERSTVPETHIQESSVIKTHVGTKRKKDALDGLPPGWTVDIRARKSGTKTKYDPYYTDPGTGYIFRSKRDVLRYLKTGKLGKYAKRTKKLKQRDITTSCSKSDEAVNNEPKLDAQLFKPDEVVNGEPLVESSAIGGGDREFSGPFPVKKKSSKKRGGKKYTIAEGNVSTQTTYVNPIDIQSVENGVEEHKRRQTQIGSKKRKKKVELDTPRRVSKRLAGIAAEAVSVMERSSGTPQVGAVVHPSEANLAFNSTGTDAKGQNVTHHVEAVEQPSEVKLAVNSTDPSGELASDLEGPDTTQAASVELPSGANLAVSLTSVDPACLVFAELDIFEPEKAGNYAADPLTVGVHLKQEGSPGITKEVTTTTCASGGEAYFEQGTSDTRREEQTTQSQPILDHVTSGNLDIETQADGNLGDPLASPFGELWTDPCLEFAYKTLTGDIPVDNGETVTISNTIPMSDPCIEFAYNTLTGAIPVGDNPSTACLDATPSPGAIPVGDNPSTAFLDATPIPIPIPMADNPATACPDAIPMSDPCIEFAYKTLTGALPVENIPPVIFTDAVPTSDPCIEFAYKTLTGALPVENIPPVIFTDAVPTSDPSIEFAYKTLTGALPVENILPVIFTDAVPTSDPCIEFAYRTLTGEIPVEAPASVVINHVVPVPVPVPGAGAVPLSDPCLEFAYKTLTGEIPLGESLAVQDYFQQESSAQTLNNNLVDGIYGSVVKPTSLIPLENDSVGEFPNETLQSFSNNVQSQCFSNDVQHP